MDFLLMGLVGWLVPLIPLLVAARVVFEIHKVASMCRQFERELECALRVAASVNPAKTQALTVEVTRLHGIWSQLDAVQRGRFENRKAELMGLTAHTGISFPP